MRVAMVIYAYYESNQRIEQYVNALVQRGDTVDIISLNRGGLPALETMRGAKIHRMQTRRVHRESFLTYAS